MRTMLWLAAVAILIPPSAGLADEENRQCWDCLKRLAMQFPAKNPQEDPFFEDALPPSSAVGAFVKCSLDDSEIPVLQQIISKRCGDRPLALPLGMHAAQRFSVR
jgi:hypothetical protein